MVESSLYRSGYELLYTPLPPETKRPTKALIDVGADKLGATAGAGLAFFILGIFPLAANSFLVAVGVVASAAALLVTRSLHRGYMASLADSLRTGTIDLAEVEAIDAVTLETIIAIDRAKVLEGIEAIHVHQLVAEESGAVVRCGNDFLVDAAGVNRGPGIDLVP